MVQKLATKRTFDGRSLVEPGFPVEIDESRLNGTETNLIDMPEGFETAIVQNAAISPTGPNPTAPQQIGPDTRQTISGYAKPGAVVVGEVTLKQEERIEAAGLDKPQTGEAKIAELMAGASTDNSDDALVAGTVAEITEGLGGKTDDELEQLRAAEVDREKPRKGVIGAIKAEQAARQS